MTPGDVSPSPGPPALDRWALLSPTGRTGPGAGVHGRAGLRHPIPSHGPALTPTWGVPHAQLPRAMGRAP